MDAKYSKIGRLLSLAIIALFALIALPYAWSLVSGPPTQAAAVPGVAQAHVFQQKRESYADDVPTPTATALPPGSTPTATAPPAELTVYLPLVIKRASTPVPPLPSATPPPPTATPAAATPTPAPPQLAGCDVFPADNIWNAPVDALPPDPNSAIYVDTIGADTHLHPDFGTFWEGAPIGIPYIDVPGTQPKVAVTFEYADESDPGPYPIPTDAPIEGGAESDGDRHVLVLEHDTCTLYEMWNSWPQGDGGWQAGSGAIFDLTSHALRPDGWTSADAAGLPILPGLVRYDEVAGGEIRHALRFTAPQTRATHIWPARHDASVLTGEQYPPMGQRFRLKAGYDMSGFAPEVQVILQALKTYGMILADNGSAWYISGAHDPRWDDEVLGQLKQLRGSDFEAVDVSSLMVDADSGQAWQPARLATGDDVP